MVHRQVLIGVGLSVLALAISVVATAIDYWYVFEQNLPEQGATNKVYAGLWEACNKYESSDISGKECWTVSQLEVLDDMGHINLDWVRACEAMMILGVVALAVSVGLPFIQAIPKKVPALTNIFGGLFCIVAAAIYAAKYKDALQDELKTGSLHAGFGMAIAGAVVAFVAGAMLAFSKRE